MALILTEVLRDNFRMSKMKIAILPALGEVLYLVALQVSDAVSVSSSGRPFINELLSSL